MSQSQEAVQLYELQFHSRASCALRSGCRAMRPKQGVCEPQHDDARATALSIRGLPSVFPSHASPAPL